ncbi:hypothetical protein H17ap60334_07413 [Thermosipho africanus H17ap60334]|uniref:DNA ADP-ribosyl transferase-DNA ADP-ribosyl glycohydrolase fusion protein n=1 Tax=Thermosipho africanus (strain H17ap60334) TaxID=1161912 RepID=DARTG_THEA7|nr:DarT ssDNA thymidine ADP-ribosyltransferase family protein [Thermosipho africanus]K2PFJ6.1 RecName: Full=DNA ADP-ribosyl transferase-DNA ADP-ribosyl glycohydrolase fusion protein; Short=DarTG [Thermosipho africanus H17ap60334]EKF49129.1 hypothetical protein H17ap60334_07413 [Thermosipho africanus H17ap60334]MDK2886946.1 hypothetical protein [Thermosipho sp. (in: thermotogales)]
MFPRFRELYYITHIDNVPSILEKGILSHAEIERQSINCKKVYDNSIVLKRKSRLLADNRSLWEFANLYFQPRNPMLYRLLVQGLKPKDLAIVAVKWTIMKRDDILITDGNAASSETQIYRKSEIKNIKNIISVKDMEYWREEDGSKRKIMAECLVPQCVDPRYISAIYVSDHEVASNLKKAINNRNIPVIPDPTFFFLPNREIKLTQNLSLVEGDMFFSRMQTLTVSVNTVGVMGKGLASRVKYQFPDVYVVFQDACKKKELEFGKPYLYKRESSLDAFLAEDGEKLSDLNHQTWFLLFPTKRHWKNMSEIKGIESGLRWIVENYKKEGIKSLAVPALGCGLGGLEWSIVGPLMCRYLTKLEIPVQIYLPLEKRIPDVQLSPKFLLDS